VHAKIEEELTLNEMAQCAGLSTAHFSQMFRKSTGESPRQFLLRRRVERAKEMLRADEMRVLDDIATLPRKCFQIKASARIILDGFSQRPK
jgi:transcriptional regulator GlxA family with amidase domain